MNILNLRPYTGRAKTSLFNIIIQGFLHQHTSAWQNTYLNQANTIHTSTLLNHINSFLTKYSLLLVGSPNTGRHLESILFNNVGQMQHLTTILTAAPEGAGRLSGSTSIYQPPRRHKADSQHILYNIIYQSPRRHHAFLITYYLTIFLTSTDIYSHISHSRFQWLRRNIECRESLDAQRQLIHIPIPTAAPRQGRSTSF